MPYKDPEKRREYQRRRKRNPGLMAMYAKRWRKNHPERYRESYALRNKRTIRFPGVNSGDIVYLTWNPRTGICSQCGKEGRTDMHHDKGYFRIFTWFGIKELCDSCHVNIRWAKQSISHLDRLSKFF